VLAPYGSGEILALQRLNIDLVAGTVNVTKALSDLGSREEIQFAPTKSDAGVREVHLPESALVHIAHHMEHFVDSDPDAFVLTGATGQPLWRTALRRHWSAAREAVGCQQCFSTTSATSPESWPHKLEPRRGIG
jgi:hypothetical protein